ESTALKVNSVITKQRVVAISEKETLKCGLAFWSIGDKSLESLESRDVSFYEPKRIVPNVDGKVMRTKHCKLVPGLYAGRRLKHEPIGVIATTNGRRLPDCRNHHCGLDKWPAYAEHRPWVIYTRKPAKLFLELLRSKGRRTVSLRGLEED
ncbi:hypothetical protein BGZ65_007546, partial [Modicella reniformis]